MKNNSVFAKIKCLYQEYKEIIYYVFWGGCTTLISISSFMIANTFLGIHELIANVISWILAVSFAYVTNRIFVFRSSAKGTDIIKEVLLFFSSRGITLILEEAILLVFSVWLMFDGVIVKISAQFVVLVLNYIISKFITFRKK